MKHDWLSRIAKAMLVLFTVYIQVSAKFEDKKYLPIKKFKDMRTVDIIKYWGYPGEEHKVTTEDGYILNNFRIPNPGGYPVLFFHGLTGTSDCWLLRNPAQDIVFQLWRKGYDVWMWNARGNLYSNQHVNMTYREEAFYLFSIHELGIYDTTASIDYILNITGHKTVITVGHSMGTSNTLIATSVRPKYQDKVKLNILLAQAMVMKHLIVKGFVDAYYSAYTRWLNVENTQSLFMPGRFYERLKRFVCDYRTILGKLCQINLAVFSGPGTNQTTQSAVAKMMTKLPTGSALNVVKQMIQIIRRGEFEPLSYGTKQNLKRYGTRYPRPYPIGNVTVPTAIYYSRNDFLSSVKDSELLKSKLKNVVKYEAIAYKKFNHGDFLWAKDSYRLLYKDVLELIDRYNPGHFPLDGSRSLLKEVNTI